MIYLKFTQVDSVTGKSVMDEFAKNGPSMPSIEGLEFGFALESEYPTNTPTFYGTAPDDSELDISGVTGVITQAEFDGALISEIAARDFILREKRLGEIPAERYRREIAGLVWSGVFIATDQTSQSKIQSTRAAVQEGLRVDGSIWKCGDPQTGEILYRPTTNAEMIDIGSMVFTYIQSCYDREGVLMNAVKDGTYTDDMLTTGWPERGSQIQLGA